VADRARRPIRAQASVNHIVQAVDTAAMVLGYLVLALLIGIVLFIASAWLDKWSYQRKKSRRHDDEWARVRSKWLLEGDFERVRTNEQFAVDFHDRLQTDVMEFPIIQDLTHQDVYNYLEESHRDAS
jgi:hypothetical protein